MPSKNKKGVPNIRTPFELRSFSLPEREAEVRR